MSLSAILSANKLTMGEASRLAHCDKSLISKVCSHTYPMWEQKEEEVIKLLEEAGFNTTVSQEFTVNTNVLVTTRSVSEFNALADDLSDPGSSLSSSLGMAIGSAELGKTHASKWYAMNNETAAYVLYVDGVTKVQLLRDICYTLANTRPHSFGACIAVIEATCRFSRRIVIIDEADKCPIPHLEMLRGINERCGLPFLFTGEEGLKGKIDYVPRLKSRIRKPIVLFEPVKDVDVAAYYQAACGILIDRHTAETLTRRARGGFRTVANDSIALSKIGQASGLNTITPAMIEQLG
jgi:hypothetical protein